MQHCSNYFAFYFVNLISLQVEQLLFKLYQQKKKKKISLQVFYAEVSYLCITCDCKTRDLLAVTLEVPLTSCLEVLHHNYTATRVGKQTCNKTVDLSKKYLI